MNRAIKVLGFRIWNLRQTIAKAEKTMEEPEMVCNIEFAMNDIVNCESEIVELQQAIQILSDQN